MNVITTTETQGYKPVTLTIVFHDQSELDNFQSVLRSTGLHELLERNHYTQTAKNIRQICTALKPHTDATGAF